MTGLPCGSVTVMVSPAIEVPSAGSVSGETATVRFAAGPDWKRTAAPSVRSIPSSTTAAVMRFNSAFVEASVAVVFPNALVGEDGCVITFPSPSTATSTRFPRTGSPFASKSVMVIVEVVTPSATTGVVAITVDRVDEILVGSVSTSVNESDLPFAVNPVTSTASRDCAAVYVPV